MHSTSNLDPLVEKWEHNACVSYSYTHNSFTISLMDCSVGDQHKAGGSTAANPFEDARPRLSEYTAQEIATLQSRLDKRLGPEYISSRPGAAGQKVHYLAAEK